MMCEMCGYDMYTISLEKEERYVIARNIPNETSIGWLLRDTQRNMSTSNQQALQCKDVEC
jgi:hypothetical protein